MSKKMGRPTVPKRDAKTNLRGAMFAQDEARTIDEAAGPNKSDWIRKSLLEHAKRHPLKNPAGSIQYLPEATALDTENRVVASGSAVLYHGSGTGEFFPETRSQTSVGTLPPSSAILQASDGHHYKLSQVEGLCQAANKPPHFHFEFEAVDI